MELKNKKVIRSRKTYNYNKRKKEYSVLCSILSKTEINSYSCGKGGDALCTIQYIQVQFKSILSTIKYAITVARTKFIFCAGFFYSLFCVFQRYRRHFRLYISDYAERG